jgi:hypothetical protein
VEPSDHDLQFREQIFIAGVCLFLVGFAVSYYRNQSLTWASLAATLALAITVGAGLLLTSFIQLAPNGGEAAEAEPAEQPAAAKRQGQLFDVSLDDEREPGQQAA